MLAVVPFSAIRGEHLKFNERITWSFSKRRATDVNTLRCNEIVRTSFSSHRAYGGNHWRASRNPNCVPFTTHFEPRPLGSPGYRRRLARELIANASGRRCANRTLSKDWRK